MDQEVGARPTRRRHPARNALLAVYSLICLGAMTWPGYAWFGNSIEPYVLGLPLSLAWPLFWIVLTFAVLVVFHATGPREDH